MSCQAMAISKLRRAGFRLTPQRALVLEAVYHNEGHLTADEVYEQVHARSPHVDRSTIYRTLLFLKQHGLIGEFRLGTEPVRYEAIRSGQEHHHAICRHCGAILEIDCADLDALVLALYQKYGFQADPVHMVIPGLCSQCAATADD